ncbi:hypothetical protein Bpfe_012252 [Biomphalaria pfeifferi]|uniref:F-box domain-containing protein n=1 Tax=Biomphalaria pfeifferi TaxID=112525 RepID=A0AAD8FCD8_BIOPF|nr:hypothetical protein Bpfe_012252 [Biomphalaria pfeifferi]
MASTLHIPFRCPNCGDNSRQFETLHDLRSHLEKEHSYTSSRYRHQPVTSSPAVGLRSRTGRHSPLTEMFHSDAQRLEESLRKRKEEELNNKRRRSEMSDMHLSKDSSGNAGFQDKIQNIPQHYSFRDYGHSSRLQKYYTPSKYVRDRQNIEGMQTNKAFPDEPYMRDKTKDEPISGMNSLFTDIQNKEGINRSSHFAETDLSSQMSPITATPNPSEKHIKDTLSALSHEVLVERASQFATADSLYTAQELLSSVEQAAEIKIAQQKKVIEILAEKLKEKENRLAGVMGQIELLSHHQMDSFEKVSILKRQSDLKAQLLQKELDQKQKDFDNLNQKLFEIQQSLVKGDSSMQKSGKIENSILNVNLSTDSPESSASMNLDPDFEKPTSFTEKMSLGRSASKTKEIKRVQNKAHQLERDRQNLLIEMQNLLQSAATDNEKLQSELASQSQELSQLSYDLEQSKHEQAALLGETHALYRQADVSLAQLKIMLKDKEGELKNVSKSLEQAKAAQSKLARERDEYVRLCQERETKYKEMMSSKSQQIQSMKKTLDLSVQDKKQLEEKLKDLKRELDAKNGKDAILSDNVAHLKSALEEKVKSQAKMKEELHKREEKLKKAKREMERMTRFLEDTAEKELEARSKLEDFISGLIDRAGRAETELQKLKEESYRLHQKSKQSSKKHRRDSNQLDLSALPGASSLVAQTSLEYDTESLSSSNIPSTYQYDQKHYHSTPRAPTTQQLAPTPLPRKLSPRNFGVPHLTNKSMNISEVDSDVHHISGDGNSKPLLPDNSLSSLVCEDAISKHETSAPSHGILQQNTADRQQNEAEKHLISSSAKLTEPPKSEVSDLPVCPACSQTMHASQRLLACPENLTASSLLYCPSHHSPSLNVSQSLTSVSPESKSLHVVPHSICIVTNSMAQSASLAPLQSQPFAGFTKMSSPVMYPVLLTNVYTLDPVNQTSLLPNHKVITDTEVADKSLFAPSTIPEFAPMYYNSTPWFYNFTSANPYNLYTDWSKQLARSLPECLLKEEETDNSLYLSYLNSKEISLFKNTPQVERMFANVFNDSHNLHGFETRRTPKDRQQPKHIFSDAEFRQRLSMDENGIMWESSHDSRTHHNQDRLKSNDDTDIDEDISDFIYDAEPTHKSDSSQYFNVKKFPNKQSKYSPQFKEMPSVGKKMAKVLNAKTYKSSARDDNKHFSSNYHPRSSNGYSSEESMEESPLQKARMVQKRLEYFTNSKPRDFLVSKQSEGFDVSHMDSDLSTSSYQSLYKPNNHVSSTVQKTVAENTIKQDELQSLPTKTEINHPEAVIVQQKYLDVQQKYPDLQKKYPDIVEKDYVNEPMEKETVVSKPSLFVVQEISDNKSNLQVLASHKQQSIQNQTPEVNQHSTVQNQPAAKYFDSIQHQVPDQHHLLEPHSPSQLVDQIKDHPLTSRGGDHMHSSEKFGAPQHLPKSTLLEALEPTPMPVKEELPHHTEVLQGQNNPHPNSAVNVSNAENDDEDVSETSSDEDYTQADLGPTSISARKESIDASTDTDLEKLARPGYVQKGLVVRKNIPTVKHIRKNKRRKPLMKRMQSGDSSEADDLDDMQRERRHFIRRMRVALFKIFSFLDTATLVKMSCVCREWCKVSRHPALWKVVKLENKAISSSFLNTLSQWCTQTESLTLKGLTGRPINGTESAEEYSNSIRGSLEAGLERFLSSCQNTITQACIDQCDNILTDKCLWLVSGYCRLLTKLTYQSSVDCVTPQLMWALGGGCPGVTSLFIQPKPPL